MIHPAGAQTSRQRRRRLLVAGGVVVLLAWCVAAATLAAGAAADLRNGERTLRRSRAELGLADLVEPGGDAALRAAAADLRSGADRLRSPVLAPARWLPVLGRQLRSATALSGSAADAVDAGIAGLADVRTVIDGGIGVGPQRVAAVRAVAAAAGRVADRLADVDLGPEEALVAPLADARAELGAELDELRDAAARGHAVADGVAGLLAGPRRYLVLATNNAEMSAGWGMPLSSGALEVADGAFELAGLADLDQSLPPGAVELTGDLARNWSALQPNVEWRNLALTPRFDEAAPLAARMRRAATGEEVDGVLAVDPFALRAVLAATGPVDVGGVEVGADTVVAYALHDQYVEAEVQDRSREERKERMAEVAGAALGALSDGDVDLSALAEGLADAVAGRHLLAWSSVPADQALWVAAGADGSLPGDALLLSLMNRGGNKLDWFVDVDAGLTIERRGDALDGVLRVVLRNRTPDGEPGYIAGPWAGAPPQWRAGHYSGVLQVHLPGATTTASVDGVDRLLVAGSDGPTRVVATRVDVPAGEEAELVVRFTLPAAAAEVEVQPSARARPTTWRVGERRWRDDRAVRVDLAELAPSP